ncbi:unnamed protein product [Caenorhabditis angaria]|uniref:Uncharacterized protein n=1 Tax=Caenorhabditis angaria TaxID=860376 RepID=A0A9P1INY6_9PELO|nr:unnamed protein product [Caenorhabditis angaria]CAI5447531.1 unnamed protein product [Caenorhabditis angaria]
MRAALETTWIWSTRERSQKTMALMNRGTRHAETSYVDINKDIDNRKFNLLVILLFIVLFSINIGKSLSLIICFRLSSACLNCEGISLLVLVWAFWPDFDHA